jgi:hypothetical protein
MKQYRYVIVSSQGTSLDFHEGAAKLPELFQPMWYGDRRFQDLQDLLADGWRPVRETGMGGASATGGVAMAFALLLLERDRGPSDVAEAIAAQET